MGIKPMGDRQVQLFCTGDLHLGRHSAQMPDLLDGSECSPRSVWRDSVREAIDRDVDAVVLTIPLEPPSAGESAIEADAEPRHCLQIVRSKDEFHTMLF